MGFILRTKAEVDFDVNNSEHAMAVEMLLEHGRQHPTLRFAVEPPFQDFPSMARDKISRKYYQDMKKENYETLSSLGSSNPVVVSKPKLRVATQS